MNLDWELAEVAYVKEVVKKWSSEKGQKNIHLWLEFGLRLEVSYLVICQNVIAGFSLKAS